ncbi:MAG TPA: GntR family transcriptional regulator [Streptosporangiaceae bacterium]|nr:GntR family transcriptional regulator [Streptosporangiaceae bacterium]
MTQQLQAAGPKYMALAAELRDQIKSGRLPPGTKLPTRDELAATYGVAVGTVLRSFDVLREEGLIRSDQGLGTFVLAPGQPPAPTPTFTEMVAAINEIRDDLKLLRKRMDDLEKLAGGRDGA